MSIHLSIWKFKTSDAIQRPCCMGSKINPFTWTSCWGSDSAVLFCGMSSVVISLIPLLWMCCFIVGEIFLFVLCLLCDYQRHHISVFAAILVGIVGYCSFLCCAHKYFMGVILAEHSWPDIFYFVTFYLRICSCYRSIVFFYVQITF